MKKITRQTWSFAITLLIANLFFVGTSFAQNYYYKGTGNINSTANWGLNTNGSGAAPSNFTSSNRVFNIRNTSAVTLNGTWTVSGTNSKIVVGDGTNACNFTVGSNFVLTASVDVSAAATITLSTTGSITGISFGTLAASSTVDFASTAAQTIPVENFGNLNISGARGTNDVTFAGATTIAGNVTITATGTSGSGFVYFNTSNTDRNFTISGNYIQSGAIDVEMGSGTGHSYVTLGGNFSKTGGYMVTNGNTENGLFNMTGANVTMQSNGGTEIKWVDFNVLSGSTCTLNGQFNYFGSTGTNAVFTVSSGGTLNCGTFNVVSSAFAQFINSGTLGIGSTAGITSSGATGNIQTATRTFNTGATYNYNGTSSQVTGNGLPAAATTLKINNTVGVTLSAALTSLTTLTIGDITANSIFNDGGLTVTSTGTLNLASGTYNVGSAATGSAFPAFATRNYSAGTTVAFVSNAAQAVRATSYPNLTFSGTGVKTPATGTVTVGETWTTGGGNAALNTNNASITVTTDIAGTGNIVSGSGTISVAGAWSNSGTFTPGTGTVSFNGGAQNIDGPSIYNNLTLTGGTKTFTAAKTINGALAISATGVANLGTFTHSANTLLLNGAGSTSGSWGSTSSPATNTNNTFFAASTGIVNIAANSCNISITLGSIADVCETATAFSIPYTAATGSPDLYSVSGTGINTVTDAALPASPIAANFTATGVPPSMPFIITVRNSTTGCVSSNINGSVTVSATPTTADAGPDQTDIATCGLTTVTLAANTAVTGTGAWSVVSGTGGSFTNAASPTSTFNGTAGNTYTLRWTISNAPCTSTDDVVVAFNRNPSTATAGADLTNCNVATFTMNATNPTVGTGAWSLIAGSAGITTPLSRTSGITGVTAGTSATLRWTVSNAPCTASTDDIVLTNVPASTVPNAGANQTHCNDASFTLAGNTITSGTGSWSLVSGTATIITPSSPTSAVAGIPAGTSATLRWTNTNAPCAVLTDDVVLINNDQPITTSAEICQGGTASLTSSTSCPSGGTFNPSAFTGTGANVTGIGTLAWTNSGNILTDNGSNASISVASGGTVAATSNYLQGTNFAFGIPATAVIEGIRVTINRSSSLSNGTNNVQDDQVRLVKAGAVTGNNNAIAGNWSTTTTTAPVYGSVSDLWGTTWTPAQINASNFGVALSVDINRTGGNTVTASVDYISVTVTYTIPGILNWFTVSSGGTAIGSGTSFNPVGVAGSGLTNTNTAGITNYWAECSTVPGCRTQTDFIINEVPTITLGTNPSVSRSTTTANLTYSAVSGSPDEYSIDFDAAAEAQGFVDVVNAALPASPIAITVPAAANAVTYNATLSVRNSIIPGCPSAGDAITVTVDPVALSITGVTADDKPYDGNNTATLSGTAAYVGLVNGETPAVTGTPAATFNDKNVGTAKPVTVTGYTAPNANYTLPAQPTGLTADINSIALTASLTGTVTKPYDGNTTATLSSANYNLAGVISPDDVSVTNTSGSYDNKDVAGSPTKTVTVTSLVLGGADAGNYTVSNAASVSGNVGTITALGVTVTPDAGQFKVFGDANPTYTYTLAPALISPDVTTGALSRVSGETIGTYAYTLGSLSAGSNYSLSLGGSNTFEIQAISQSNADFRSKANGNFSDAGTWEYDLGGGTWTNASQAPTSANDVSILHDVALDQNYTVGASKNFSISGSGTFTVNPTRTFTVAGTANFGGKLVTFKSDNSGTSSLGQVTGTLNGATNVTVERYVPNNGFRSWRLLSVPTSGNGQTIRQAWQEGVANPSPLQNNLANFGTQITGPGLNQASSQAAGFDDAGNTAALLTWNGTGWSSVTGTNTAIAADKAYFLYIRGERSKGVSGTVSNSSATTLRTNGTVYTGDQVNNIGANAFALVPNLYPSAINFTGLTRTGGVSNLFYIWDSKKQNGNSLGMYQTFSGTNGFSCLISGGSYVLGDPNVAIESGQAFFVQSNATPGTITLKESSKNGGGSSLGLRPATPASALVKIDTKLYNGNSNMLDANVVVFDAAYSNAVDGDDAPKLPNPGENVAVQRGTSVLVIEGRQPAVNNDVIQFKMWNMMQQAYKFEFIAANMSSIGLTAVLEDAYLNTSTPLDLTGTSTINFTVDANAASASSNRFRIVFKQLTPVPVSFISISGNRTNAGIKVDWKVAAERSIRNYEVERSTDGRNFSTVGAVTATGNSSTDLTYTLTDASAPTTAVFYRIKSNGLAGDIKYSSIVKVGAGNVKPGYAVSPNPVENGIMNLQFKNQPAGKYSVTILTNNGQRIMQLSITHADGSSSQEVTLPETMARGTYQVEIIAPDHTRTVQTLFVNKK